MFDQCQAGSGRAVRKKKTNGTYDHYIIETVSRKQRQHPSPGAAGGVTAFPCTGLIAVSAVPRPGISVSWGESSSTSNCQTRRNRSQSTGQFRTSTYLSAKYQPLFGCVSGPDHGAMGIHYINLALFGDGELDATKPEALIYEPSPGGLRLVGVEYIVDAAAWLAHHNAPPVLEGQAFQFVNSPNRYGLAAFFELHVWAWRENPNGAFVDWNRPVTCEGQ